MMDLQVSASRNCRLELGIPQEIVFTDGAEHFLADALCQLHEFAANREYPCCCVFSLQKRLSVVLIDEIA